MPSCATAIALTLTTMGLLAGCGSPASGSEDHGRQPCPDSSCGSPPVKPCPEALLCHVDLTCIEPNVADDDGIATLAVSLGRSRGSCSGGVAEIIVTDDFVVWYDKGTWSPNDYGGTNGSLHRMDHVTGDTTVLVQDDPSLPLDVYPPVVLDGDALYFSSTTIIRRSQLDGSSVSDIPVPWGQRVGPWGQMVGEVSAWTVSDGFVYYTTPGSPTIVRYDITNDLQTEVFNAGEGVQIGWWFVADDGPSFVESYAPHTSSTQLWTFDPREATSELVVDSLRPTDAVLGSSPLIAHDDFVLISESDALTRVSIESRERGVVVREDERVNAVSVRDGYAYYVHVEPPSGPSGNDRYQSIKRVPLNGGEPEVLYRTSRVVEDVVVSEGTLHWAEDRKLFRKHF